MRTKAIAAPAPRKLALAVAVAGLGAAAVFSVVATRSEAAPGTESRQLATLRGQLAEAQRDARFWQQLTAAFTPARKLGLNSMADHLMVRTPGGPVLALHFDNMNLDKARNLNWVAFAVPGHFSRADQARVNRLYGPGFTHFHDLKTDVHGGKLGTKGVWFVHIGTRNFRSPFGRVRVGKVDLNFMPTRPPAR
jgi:hypothetical protein